MIHRLVGGLLLSMILGCASMNAMAETDTKHKTSSTKSDSNKPYPITVSADELVSQTKGGQSEYRGKVMLTRNKLEAHGDTLLILHPNDKLQTATLTGKLAKFKDFMPKKQEWVNGEAKQIIFDQQKDTITLKDDAVITTDKGNQIKAEQIILYNKTETFEAVGDKKHGTRVQMVIQADN
jgi:lipopolysaccharide export system protein LptA